MRNFLAREPVAILGLLQAGLAIAISFGMKLSIEQQGMILAGTSAVLALLARAYVTPVAAPNLAVLAPIPEPVYVPIPDPGPFPDAEAVPEVPAPDAGPYPSSYPAMPPIEG
jgi:hypothetical protein